MAINFTDFTNANRAQNKYEGISELLPNILEGYKAARTPETMDADLDLKKAQTQKALMENKAGGLSGSLGNAAKLYALEQQLGQDHPLVESLKKMQNLEQEREQGILDWQKANINALPTRLLTTQGKTLNELEDLKNGYKLGSTASGKKEKLDPADAAFQVAQYEMGLLKDITDPEQLKRVRSSADVHTTLGLINKNDAFKYSGLWGEAAKKAAQSRSSLTNKEDEAYSAFEENSTRMAILAKQLSTFFGSSASEGIQEGIAFIANPNSWKYSPKVAQRKYEALIELFEAESKNQLNALRNSSVYGAQSPSGINEDQMNSAIQQSQQAQQPSGIDVSAVLRAIAERNR